MRSSDDPFDLSRFLIAQAANYSSALAEIRSGRKRTHWMWYVFPQFNGLGYSATSKYYAIKSMGEAEAYLQHPVLGARLVECSEAAVAVEGRSAADIFGYPDDVKLQSCATLFAQVPNSPPVFNRLLEKYFNGEPDGVTLALLQAERSRGLDKPTVSSS
jgi:uncharacterized protein (DUF1810 family)